MASTALTLDSLPRNPRESVKVVVRAAHKQLKWAAALHENVEGALAAGALFNRVVLMPPARTLVCAADKVGSTTINRIASLVLGKPLGKNNGVFIGVPAAFNVSFAKFKRLLKDDSWNRVLLYRDPIERFVSAYQSKCLLRDRDGRKRCHNVFQLEEPSIEAVVARLPRYGYTNAHWAPLSHFCGGTVGAAWSAYSHHIPLHNLSAAFPELLRGRVQTARCTPSSTTSPRVASPAITSRTPISARRSRRQFGSSSSTSTGRTTGSSSRTTCWDYPRQNHQSS